MDGGVKSTVSFKKFYENVCGNLKSATENVQVSFTHGKFYGWVFTIKAEKIKALPEKD